MKKSDPLNPPGNMYALGEKLYTFAALLWTFFGDLFLLQISVFRLWEILNIEAVRKNRSKFTPLRCAQVTWQVLEDTRLFFVQSPGPNYFSRGGPRHFLMADLTGLIDDVQQKKPLYLVTIQVRLYFKNEGRFGYNNQGGNNAWLGNQGHKAKIPKNPPQGGLTLTPPLLV